jgi:hypothetical protein
MNIDIERISMGLPEAPVAIPDHIMIAYKDGIIKDQDVVHNLHAYIHATHKPNIEPPLSAFEEVARTQQIMQIARLSVAEGL